MKLLLQTPIQTPTCLPLLSISTISSSKRPFYPSFNLISKPLISLRPSATTATAVTAAASRWVVSMDAPPSSSSSSRADVIDYYVRTLSTVLPSEREAQMCIYRAEWEGKYVFCCDIEEEASRRLAGMPGVLSVVPDKDLEPREKDYNASNILSPIQTNSDVPGSKFSPSENCEYWLVKLDKPAFEVVTKAQMVDYFVLILTKVLGNEKDAQVCIYNISWEKDLGFCCQIDETCARELSDVPGVLSVEPDVNFESGNKNYKADDIFGKTKELHDSSEGTKPDVKTKRLFVTGLSFYTSDKTLRAAFEPFGELVEVKIIMDKISKRSKGYAFLEYTTEEAGGAALKEMNGKIINGWMIVVDVAKTNAPKYSRAQPRPPQHSPASY